MSKNFRAREIFFGGKDAAKDTGPPYAIHRRRTTDAIVESPRRDAFSATDPTVSASASITAEINTLHLDVAPLHPIIAT
jgi:hypothetical protein